MKRDPDMLDDTLDEGERPRAVAVDTERELPIGRQLEAERIARDQAYFDAARGDPRAPETVDLDARVTAATDLAKKMSRRWAWMIAVGSLLSALVAPLSIYAGKKLLASERASGAEHEREATRLEDHRLLYELRDRFAEMRGALRALNPVGVLRLQGPTRATEPEPQD